MRLDDEPDYPRGFLLATSIVTPPGTFEPGPVLPNFWIHPWTSIDVAREGKLLVVVIGVCVPTFEPPIEGVPKYLLGRLQQKDDALLEALSDFAGRYAVIFGSVGHLKIVNDATSMRSVFYAPERGIVASHALLVEESLGEQIVRSKLPVQHGFPGNRTPFSRTKVLTPNTYLDLARSCVVRFWPSRSVPEADVDDAAARVIEQVTRSIRVAAQGHNLRLALTAGLDSRVLLAMVLHTGVSVETYTYGTKSDTAVDRAFARDLAKQADVPHAMIPNPGNGPGLQHRLARAHYLPHHVNVVQGLMEWFPGHESFAVTGNLLEIGRRFYAKLERLGASAPIDAESMAALHRRKMRASANRRIAAFGDESWTHVAKDAFRRYVVDTDYEQTLGLIDPFDLFYWEHRMGTWHGPAMNERDFYAEAFIPFNSRRIFELMLGLNAADREAGTIFYRMIQMTAPELLKLPINPKVWPESSAH
ncbi:hypothetical protein [Brevibacterium sp. CFH 10365]|uniref:hypothetical protein n=1 Tax=Brevibacterium sp. CFH 10365 TaxID=2585207 RepID=UPI0012664CFB|nr:hypothetical protein [Brevibacterium sp. CFH 10365]